MKTMLHVAIVSALLFLSPQVFAQLDKQPGPSVTGIGRAVYIPGTETILVIGYDDGDLAKRGVYRSEDDGETFSQVVQSDNPLDIYQHGGSIYHVSAVENAWRSDDDGETWTLMDPLPFGTVGDFEIASNGDMYSIANGKVYKSMDDGANWALSNTGIPSGSYVQDIEALKTIADVFTVQTYDGIYASSDGANWTAASGLPATATYQGIFTMYMANYLLQQAVGCTDAMVVVTQDGEVYTSIDGFNYTYVNTIPGLGVLSAYLVSLDPLQQGRVYAIVDQGTGQLLFEWDFCDDEWRTGNSGWLNEGAAEMTNNGTGSFFNPIMTNQFNFKTGADTTVGLLMTGMKIENGDTFRIFRTNITLSDEVGITDVQRLEGVFVYPTVVASGQGFTLHNEGMAITAEMMVTDLSGKRIAYWNNLLLAEGKTSMTLPTGLSAGHYLVRLSNTNTGQANNYKLIVANK